MEHRNYLKEYEELTAEERAQVDKIVKDYESDESGSKEYTIKVIESVNDKGEDVYGPIKTIKRSSPITSKEIDEHMSKFADEINRVNEKLDKVIGSKTLAASEARMQKFVDKWSQGGYGNNTNISNENSQQSGVKNYNSEISELKKDMSQLHDEMSEMMKIIKEKLK